MLWKKIITPWTYLQKTNVYDIALHIMKGGEVYSKNMNWYLSIITTIKQCYNDPFLLWSTMLKQKWLYSVNTHLYVMLGSNLYESTAEGNNVAAEVWSTGHVHYPQVYGRHLYNTFEH
jgi:hypothetical protein